MSIVITFITSIAYTIITEINELIQMIPKHGNSLSADGGQSVYCELQKPAYPDKQFLFYFLRLYFVPSEEVGSNSLFKNVDLCVAQMALLAR